MHVLNPKIPKCNRQVSGNHNKYTCKIKMHNFLLRGGTRHIISIYVFIQQVYTFFHTFSFDHCLYIEEIYEPFKPIGPFDQIKSKAPMQRLLFRQRVRTMRSGNCIRKQKVHCFSLELEKKLQCFCSMNLVFFGITKLIGSLHELS